MRFVTTALAAGVLLIATAGCRSTYKSTTTTTTETSQATPTTAPETTASSYGTSSTASLNTSTQTTQQTTTTTTEPAATTTTLPNGTTMSKSESTTIVYPDGTVKKIEGNGTATSMTSESTASTSSVPTLPPGAQVVTKTVTTVKTTPAPVTTTQAATLQPIYITTTPPNIYNNVPPMTSSTTTIYQPYRQALRGRRFPGFNLLAFADRASFSSSNSSLNGTVNTGQFSSDIRHENGWGGGINIYLGRTNFSTEFTYSRIRPTATLTPSNTAFNPITNFRFRMEPLTGTLQLHFNPRSSVDAYLGGGGAYVMFHPDNGFNPGTTGLTAIHFRDEWGPLVNAGIGFGFSPNFGLNFDAKYMWVRAKATTTFNDVTIGNVGNSERLGVNPFVVSAGLRFGF